MVDVLWDREVKRCFNCQRHGHLARACTMTTQTCGLDLWAGSHDTRACTRTTFKCANCNSNHRAGDALCGAHVAAVKGVKEGID